MGFNQNHYHITVVCERTFIEPLMTTSFVGAVTAYNDAIGVLKDREGLDVESRGFRITTFTDKSTVKYRECTKNCMEEHGTE